MPSLNGQYILVIGGSSGIGFAVAQLALAEGVRVAIASSSRSKINNAVERLNSTSPKHQVTGYLVDLLTEDLDVSLDNLLKNVTKDGTLKLDHIIHTAGRPGPLEVKDFDLPSLQNAGRLHFFAPLLLAKVAPKFLNPGPTSSLIFTTGQVSQKPIPAWSVVAAYASGVHGMTRGLALDLKPLRVNLVSPGATDTELWGPAREQMRDDFAKTALLGKAGTPEEVAEAYIYFMRDTNATGSIVSSDGGHLLQ
ncbi:hypothetical protein BDV29DRAFT_34065 [Aspergillus leporis]|uniref:NAD(P)-binding protein n=1 Tax=Aspergillus leporis TaxID=41062 RepID=A0A5N5WTA4_9EURO|nr:hypothetical protein BDV29DRAFT_34065 [Aspergillus leporis]